MKSRTSFFNTTVLRKDLTRFAPVWGLFAIFQVLFVLLLWGGEDEAARFAVNSSDILTGMGILNLLYAGLCAFLLFGDLFVPRMCNALHAMPLHREGWFLTHLTAGMLFCLIPSTIGALLAALLLQQYAYAAFLWLAIMVLQYLFFFGASAFSAMCAGNALGGIAVYSIFNFFAVLAAWLAVTFYEPVLYGVTLHMQDYVNFSPVVAFSQASYFEFRYDNTHDVADFLGCAAADWGYLFVAAGVGIVLLGLAVLIYRRRDLESAGDLISLRPVAPVFLVIYTLCAGAVMYFIAEVFSNGLRYIFLLLGLAIGFFTGRMLLEKKVNIFSKKSFLGFGILVGAFVLSIVITLADPIGITRFVPEAQRVEQVKISPYTSQYYIQNESCTLTNPEDIAAITEIHSELVSSRRYNLDSTVTIRYEMKNGTVVQRQYQLATNSDIAQRLRAFYSRPEAVLGDSDLGRLCEQFSRIEIYPYGENHPRIFMGNTESLFNSEVEEMAKYAEEEDLVIKEDFSNSDTVKGLMRAIIADCEAGNMAQAWNYHSGDPYGTINLVRYVSRYQTEYRDITIYDDCENTIEFLRQLVMKPEYQ